MSKYCRTSSRIGTTVHKHTACRPTTVNRITYLLIFSIQTSCIVLFLTTVQLVHLRWTAVFRHTGPLKLIMSNVSNAVNGHTMYVWMYLQNCWQEPSRASVPSPYPRTELSIANVHYNSNVLTAKRSTQTLTLLFGFVTALVLPFWPVAILTMNHPSMLVLVHPTSSWMHWATHWRQSALFVVSSLASSQVESIPSDLVGQCPMSMFFIGRTGFLLSSVPTV